MFSFRKQPLLIIFCLCLLCCCTYCEIHRVKSHSGKKVQPFKERSPAINEPKDNRAKGPEQGPDGSTAPGGEDNMSHTETCVCAMIATVFVGLSGIFPLILPIDTSHSLKDGKDGARFRRVLAFAVGGLLGDVFLHLLPEAWAHVKYSNDDDGPTHSSIGLWVIFGLLTFMILEKILSDELVNKEHEKLDYSTENSKGQDIPTTNGGQVAMIYNGSTKRKTKNTSNGKKTNKNNNGSLNNKNKKNIIQNPPAKIQVTGYLNLFANFIDNFTHGLAVAGSFLVSKKVGVVTTFAIMLHEIPHEIGDFAILLRAGFDRKSAAWNQVMTATGGMLGALFALASDSAESVGSSSAWVLPFTSGGFLFISLVTIVPELLEEKDPIESVKQVIFMCFGIAVMFLVSYLHLD
ncbi:zinc transporter ZIP13-like isoform X2 [Anneissia japonica]|uniref:zinc transporter ZIP13-like isoform X2 n=1 Tax=Anneissia japonica TaxID=1529436 RepID=UPI0014259E76|nr:zinc transporter ZIP13-like isoform X2 [Anneissia japonica]